MPALRSRLFTRATRTVLLLTLIAVAALQLGPANPSAHDSNPSPSVPSAYGGITQSVDTGVRLPPAVEGWITRAYTAGPVSGATVAINGLTLATSDASGHFEASASQLQNAG